MGPYSVINRVPVFRKSLISRKRIIYLHLAGSYEITVIENMLSTMAYPGVVVEEALTMKILIFSRTCSLSMLTKFLCSNSKISPEMLPIHLLLLYFILFFL